MENKTEAVKRLVSEGNLKKALSIAKSFRLGVTKDQQSKMTRAYECMVHPDFYRSIGTDIQEAIDEGAAVLAALFGTSTVGSSMRLTIS